MFEALVTFVAGWGLGAAAIFLAMPRARPVERPHRCRDLDSADVAWAQRGRR